MNRRALLVAGGAVVVVALVGLGAVYAYFFSGLRSAPKPLALSTPTPVASATATPAASDLSGTWTVASGSQAEYRVNEVFAGQTSSHQAVARTSSVSGELTVAAAGSTMQATNLNFTAQLTSLASVDTVPGFNVSNRDRLVQQSLSTGQFPNAVFKSGSLVLPANLASGTQVQLSVPGQLTIHGVTKDVTAAVTVQASGSQVQAAGSIQTDMAAFNITPPSAPFTTVDKNITIGFRLNFAKS